MVILRDGLEVLVPEEERLLSGSTTMILLKWKLKLSPVHFGILIPLTQQAKKGGEVLAGVIEPEYQGEIELLLHNGGNEDDIWSTGAPLRLQSTRSWE